MTWQQRLAQIKPLVVAGTSGANTPMLVIAMLSVTGVAFSLIGRGYAADASHNR